MSIKALIFAIVGGIVAAFYALESFLSFQANGFSVPLVAKLLLCGIGAYFCWRNITRIKKGASVGSSGDAV